MEKDYRIDGNIVQQQQLLLQQSVSSGNKASVGSSVPIYAQTFDGHLPLHWLQPRDQGEICKSGTLPSFRDLQLKTHRTLYGTNNSTTVPPRDKSPKGSVDSPIRHMVDLINSHSRFCTLSSCSGRLSLFDPSGSSEGSNDINESDEPTANHFTETSGKGRGRWVLVSHDQVAPEALVEAMNVKNHRPIAPFYELLESGSNSIGRNDEVEDAQEDLQPWTFRFEPMLLHVAAASLEDGRRLLTIALNLGFRESGLVVTDKRVTVAIRSHSLSTATPLFPSTIDSDSSSCSLSLCAPPFFLRALVKDANQRLEANWKHLDRLYRSMESTLFEVRISPPPLVIKTKSSCIQTLNLWNAASIGPIYTTASNDTSSAETKREVWIWGGYGCGPKTSEKHLSARRSSKLYKLELEVAPNGSRNEQKWKEFEQLSSSSSPSSTNHHLHTEIVDGNKAGFLKLPVGKTDTTSSKKPQLLGMTWLGNKAFLDLQGMTSCPWRKTLYLLWGGRKSPTQPTPSSALCVIDTATTTPETMIGTVNDVRGDFPRPRWGHQLVTLSGDRVLLLGGCNHEDGTLDDAFILHFCTQDETDNGSDNTPTFSCGYFVWERLSFRLPTPRFHFGVALLNSDTIVVMGGLESTTELLKPFEANTEPLTSTSSLWSCRIGQSRITRKIKSTKLKTSVVSVKVESSGMVSAKNFDSFFGMACCTLLSKNLLLVTGGIQQNAASALAEPIQAYWVSNNTPSILRIQRIGLGYDRNTDSVMKKSCYDFGSLVHHCCETIADNEILLAGGGVPSFAFGECYARSHHLIIDIDYSSRGQKIHSVTNKNSDEARSKMSTDKYFDSTMTQNQRNILNDPSSRKEASEIANVVYVTPKHARRVKNSLKDNGWLEKRYRMIKIEREIERRECESKTDISPNIPKQIIAIPISASFPEVHTVLGELIVNHGEEKLPLSTSQYASNTKQEK